MRDRTRLWLGRTFIAAGGLLLLFWAAVWIDARWFQAEMARRLEAFGPGSTHALRVARATRQAASASGLVGRLEIPRVGISTMVVEGTSGRALRRGVGHVKGTAFPGERGNVALAGHRDTYFRRLGKLRDGDLIRIRTPDGEFAYQVDSIMIVKPNRGDLLHATREPVLTLVTCYPFHWVGPAPQRYVVRARRATPASSDPVARAGL